MPSNIIARSNPERTYAILDSEYRVLYSSEPDCTLLHPRVDRVVRTLTAQHGQESSRALSACIAEHQVLVRVYRLAGSGSERFAVMLERYRTRITG